MTTWYLVLLEVDADLWDQIPFRNRGLGGRSCDAQTNEDDRECDQDPLEHVHLSNLQNSGAATNNAGTRPELLIQHAGRDDLWCGPHDDLLAGERPSLFGENGTDGFDG